MWHDVATTSGERRRVRTGAGGWSILLDVCCTCHGASFEALRVAMRTRSRMIALLGRHKFTRMLQNRILLCAMRRDKSEKSESVP